MFIGLRKHALAISNAIGVQKADEPRVMASWLFMRLCVTARSLETLFEPQPALYGTITYLDHGSIANLSRALIENVTVMLYIGDITISKDEWQCRKQIIDIYDCRSRAEFLPLIGYVSKGNPDKILTKLQERVKTNPFFMSIPEKRRKRLLDGDDMFIEGRQNTMKKFGWGDDLTKGVYKYLSMQAHTMPMAFHRTDANKLYERDSESARVTAGFSTEFARRALGAACIRMLDLFPDDAGPQSIPMSRAA
jgi:hypothetical protein